MTDALLPLALAVLGLPTVVGSVGLVARHFVYKHADQVAASIRGDVEAPATEARPIRAIAAHSEAVTR